MASPESETAGNILGAAASAHGDPRRPGSYPNRALFLLVGLTPQVISETVFALTRPGATQFMPTTIRIFTTGAGEEAIHTHLLEWHPDPWRALIRDYSLETLPQLDRACITLLEDGAGNALEDIHDRDALLAAGTLVLEALREVIASPEGPSTAIHLSIAGGRKSMGTLAAQAMSLVGRDQDRLSHVLISPPFEDAPEFFFPPRRAQYMHVRVPPSRPGDTATWTLEDASKARVELADIPFLRVGALLPAKVRSRMGSASFTKLVSQAQDALSLPRVVISLSTTTAHAANRAFKMGFKALAFFVALARRREEGIGSQASDDDVATYLDALADIRRKAEAETDAEIAENLADDDERLLASGSAEARSKWARLAAKRHDDKFKDELGDFLAAPYLLVRTAKPVRYLLPSAVEISIVDGPLPRGV